MTQPGTAAGTMAGTVRVGLGARAYDIHIGAGLIANAGDHIAPLLPRRKTVIVTDEHVAALHGQALTAALARDGIAAEMITLPAGEATKRFEILESLTEQLLALGVERKDAIIALGGGVIGDITGFAASILRRGCRFIQIPTSLLAQVDSSVGGKTAINAKAGKNLIGAFHQPALVLADTDVLHTLPERELKAGYAEIVKYGALGDFDFFEWLEENGTALLTGDDNLRREAVTRSVSAKARIVEEDETEGGVRALLNLGHTFGHALEAATGYSSTLLHGEGVAIGMAMALRFSAEEGLCPGQDAARLEAHLTTCGMLPDITTLAGVREAGPEGLLKLMYQDKKVEDGKLTLILARRLGDAFIARDVEPDKVTRFLERYF